LQLFLYYIGKPRDAALNAYTEEFLKRTRRWTAVECREIDPARFAIPEKRKGARRIYLDPAGKTLDTGQFTALLRGLEDEGRDAVFLVGAHEGLTAEQREEADLMLSLSAFTLSHELARAVLAEQIYRAFAALRGHPYGR
jgi:23S rRNA (pseudouridine1915-N3)-methyltransferase